MFDPLILKSEFKIFCISIIPKRLILESSFSLSSNLSNTKVSSKYSPFKSRVEKLICFKNF